MYNLYMLFYLHVTGAKYNERDLRQLHIFEKECAANYRLKKAEKERAEVPESISRIEKK